MDRNVCTSRLALLLLLAAPAPLAAQEHGPSTHPSEHADTAHAAAGDAHASGHGDGSHEAPISPSRPGLAENTGTVGRGVVQVEGGYSLTRVESENSHSIGELVVRYGLGERAELRLGLNSFAIQASHGSNVSGMQDVALGAKARLVEGHGALPSVSVLAATTLPTGAAEIGSAGVQPTGIVSLGWRLGERVALTTAGHYTYGSEAEHRYSELTAAAALGVALTHHLHAHAEYAEIARADHLSEGLHHLSGGFGYHLTSDLQLDLWSGYARHHGEGEILFGFGLARRW